MKLVQAVILSGILHNCIHAVLSCSPIEDWLPIKPSARARMADIVIYGTVRASPRHGPKDDHFGIYSAVFEVHCCLKGGILPQIIKVYGFGYDGGLCTHSPAYLNKTYIAFIYRLDYANSTEFYVHDVNIQSATINVRRKKSVLKDIMETVGKNATLPLGATNDSLPGCPTFSHPVRVHPTRRLCHPRSHKHKKRKHKNCHVTSTPSAQTTRTMTELPNSRNSFMSSKVRTKATLLSTTTKRQGNVEFLLQSHSSAYRTQSICWCFVLIFHGLVLAAVKWHQT